MSDPTEISSSSTDSNSPQNRPKLKPNSSSHSLELGSSSPSSSSILSTSPPFHPSDHSGPSTPPAIGLSRRIGSSLYLDHGGGLSTDHDVATNQNMHDHEGHDHDIENNAPSPAIQQLRLASGFASVKVGLGSPTLLMKKEWLSRTRKDSSGSQNGDNEKFGSRLSKELNRDRDHDDNDNKDIIGDGNTSKRSSMIDMSSGLPSPPQTDISVHRQEPEDQIETSLDVSSESSPHYIGLDKVNMNSADFQQTPVRRQPPPRPPRRVSSTASSRHSSSRVSLSPAHSLHSTPSIHSSRSLNRLHRSTPPLASLSRSTSSSHNLHLDAPHRGDYHRSPSHSPENISKTPERSSSQNASSTSVSNDVNNPSRAVSPNLENHEGRDNLARSSTRNRPVDQYQTQLKPSHRSGEKSERKTIRRSQDLHPTRKRSPRLETDTHFESRLEDDLSERQNADDDFERRIKEAEEALNESSSRHQRISHSRPDRIPLPRHDSYNDSSLLPDTAPSTLRRSATLSTASAVTPSGDSSERLHHSIRVLGSDENGSERDRSGGSGSSGRRKPLPVDFRNGGLFTPSPKANNTNFRPNVDTDPRQLLHNRSMHVLESPDFPTSSSHSRFSTASRIPDHSSSIDRFLPPSASRSLARSSSLAQRGELSRDERRYFAESVSGLPSSRASELREGLNQRHGESSRRPQSVLGTMNATRYPRRNGSGESQVGDRRIGPGVLSERNLVSLSRGSRTALFPADSVSAVGTRSEYQQDPSPRKDPLEIVRRMEQSRKEHQKQWEVERSSSALGGEWSSDPTRRTNYSPQGPRPTTSMSSLRESYTAPRTAPLERWRSRDLASNYESPIQPRGSRLSLQVTSTDPRPMRSTTSLSMRPQTNLEFPTASTEHGRLLFEAVRTLDAKLSSETSFLNSDLPKILHSSARSCEAANSSIRQALQLISEIQIQSDLNGVDGLEVELGKLAMTLREGTKFSDQNVRDLTRVMLDLPKAIKGSGVGLNGGGSTSLSRTRQGSISDRYDPIRPSPLSSIDDPRRWTPASPINRYDETPIRQSVDLVRPSTSMAELHFPTTRYSLDSRRILLQPRQGDKERTSVMSNLAAKVRNLSPRKSTISELQTIEQSPPRVVNLPTSIRNGTSSSSFSKHRPPSSHISSSHSLDAEPPVPVPAPLPLPPTNTINRSPRQPQVLKKKSSTMSTHTLKGSSFPPASGVGRTTTAISTITVGDLDHLSTRDELSIRSLRIGRNGKRNSGGDILPLPDQMASSPVSKDGFNLQRGSTGLQGRSFDSDRGRDQEHNFGNEDGPGSDLDLDHDAVSILEQNLANAAKRREEEASSNSNSNSNYNSSLRNKRNGKVDDDRLYVNGSMESLGKFSQSSDYLTKDRYQQNEGEGKPTLSERFKATLRRSSSLRIGKD